MGGSGGMGGSKTPKTSPKLPSKKGFPAWVRHPCRYLQEQFNIPINCSFHLRLLQQRVDFTIEMTEPVCNHGDGNSQICFIPGYDGSIDLRNLSSEITLNSKVRINEITSGGEPVGSFDLDFDYCFDSSQTSASATLMGDTNSTAISPSSTPEATPGTRALREINLQSSSIVSNQRESENNRQLQIRPTLCGCGATATFPWLNTNLFNTTDEDSVECTCTVCPGGGIVVSCELASIPVVNPAVCPGEQINTITSILGTGVIFQPTFPDFLNRINFDVQ